jgi:hypothetical protein
MTKRRFRPKVSFDKNTLLHNKNKWVVNLSKYQLSIPETLILCKGLSFCPIPLNINKIEYERDILLFNRRLRLAHFFQDSVDTANTIEPFKQSSGWTPQPGKSLELDTFIASTNLKLLESNKKTNTVSNITKEEREAIISLKNNNDIIIKPADKGGAVVILDKTAYIQEGIRRS